MYRTFFNLKSKPFEINTDSNFLWLGAKHKEALAALRYGILENKGFLLMTGDSGTGKSTLINALTESLDTAVIWAVIKEPLEERLDFYNAISKGFGIAKECTSKVQFLIQFSHFLHKADDEGKKVLLVIDDCHRLSQDMLEELRLLSNIEKADAKLINIFFVGQREFNEMLVHLNNRAVRQRIAIKVELAALTAGETEEYVHHRLQVAGNGEQLFSEKAMQIIYRYAMGIPKRINIICEHALVAGAAQGERYLDHKILEECIQKLNLPLKQSQEDLAGFDDGKKRFEQPRAGVVAGSIGTQTPVPGFNLGTFARSSWLKLGVGMVALVLAAVYFWFPGSKSSEIARQEPRKVEERVVAKETPQVVRSSPAVTVLEQNPEEINEKKAAEMKQAILDKAHSNGDHEQQGAGELTGAKIGDTAQPSGSMASPGPAKDLTVKPAVEKETAPTGTTMSGSPKGIDTAAKVPDTAAKTPETAVKVPETVAKAPETAIKAPEMVAKVPAQTTTAIDPAVAKNDAKKLPILQYKLVLPLEANSAKLTNEANKEYQGFVEKLKSYPKAKLLIKGFVSSVTDSAENTKLSEERAMVVQKMFVGSGVEASRIQIKGMGIQEPILPNNTSEGRSKNRRVEVYVVESGE